MSEELTEQQARILEFLRQHIRDHGYPPTVRAVADAVDMASTSSVRHQLLQLEGKGWIRRVPGSPRAIEIVDTNPLSPTDQEKADWITLSIRSWPDRVRSDLVPVGEVIAELVEVIRRKRDELTAQGLLPQPGNHTDTEEKHE